MGCTCRGGVAGLGFGVLVSNDAAGLGMCGWRGKMMYCYCCTVGICRTIW